MEMELSKKSNRGCRMTKSQKDILVNYLENNKEDMLSYKVGPANFGKIATHWDTLSDLLNVETKGAKKTVKQWKEAWNELKSNARRKARDIRYDITGTGGGKKKAKILSEIEERILQLLSSVVIEGVPLPEAGGVELDSRIIVTEELGTNEDLVGVYVTLPVEEEVQQIQVPASLLETPTALQMDMPTAAVQVDEVAPPSAVNKQTPKKRKYHNPIQQVATMHEKCLHDVAASNNNIAASNSNIAKALIRLAGSISNKVAKGSSVFQLKF